MAIGINLLTSGVNGGVAGNSFDTASITPSDNALVLIAVHLRDGADPGTVVITGGGFSSWTQIFDSYYDQTGTDGRFYLWRALAASPGSAVVNISTPDNASVSHAAWSIVEFTGVDTTGTDGSGAVVQTGRDPASDPAAGATSRTVSLAAFGSANNATYAASGREGTTAYTIDANMTLAHDETQNGRMVSFYKLGNEQTVDVTHGASSSVLFALEVKAAGGVAQAIGQAIETSTAQAVGAVKTLVIAQGIETDLAQALTAAKVYLIGAVTETDLAQALVAVKTYPIAQSIETDLAQALVGAQVVPIDQAIETDTATALGVLKTALIAQAIETSLAQALGSAKALAIASVLETDLAQAVTARKTYPIGIVTETDLAQTLTHSIARAIAQATETDTAFAVTAVGGFVVVHIEGRTYAILVSSGAVAALNDRGFSIATLTPSKSEV